jgi:hypothetical protein
MKRFMTRSAPGLAAMALTLGLALAACAPSGGGGGGGGDTTIPTSSTTSTTIVSGPPACSFSTANTFTLGAPKNAAGDYMLTLAQGNAAATNTINVCWNYGIDPATSQPVAFNRAVYILECNSPSSTPGFQFPNFCSTVGQVGVNGVSDPGSGTKPFVAFRGDETSGDQLWGIYAPNDTPTAGNTKYTRGFIRITLDNPANNTDAKDIPFVINN